MKKKTGIICLLLITAAVSLSAREFKDAKGRTMEAELLAHAGDSVIISRGGKEFTIKTNSLSLDDQAYIAKWIKENPDAERFNFRYFVDLDEGIRKNAKVDYDERLQTIPMEYSLSITNNSPGPLEDATVKCMVFVEDFVDTRGNRFRNLAVYDKPKNGRIQRILATVPVKSVNSQGRVDVDITFPIHYYVDRDGGRVDNAVKDKVLGVWIRVMKGDKLIGERMDSEDSKKMNSVEWKDSEAEKTEAKVEIK